MSHSQLANTHPFLGALLVVGFIAAIVCIFAFAALTQARPTCEPCVCAGTGDHDGQPVDCCDECRPE